MRLEYVLLRSDCDAAYKVASQSVASGSSYCTLNRSVSSVAAGEAPTGPFDNRRILGETPARSCGSVIAFVLTLPNPRASDVSADLGGQMINDPFPLVLLADPRPPGKGFDLRLVSPLIGCHTL